MLIQYVGLNESSVLLLILEILFCSSWRLLTESSIESDVLNESFGEKKTKWLMPLIWEWEEKKQTIFVQGDYKDSDLEMKLIITGEIIWNHRF